MKHLVLLGDSIFDNGVYVDTNDAVIDQLNQQIPSAWKTSLLAVDGDVINDVYAQLENLPLDTTIAFLSVGGNDALSVQSVLSKPTETIGSAMEALTLIKSEFQHKYASLLYRIKQKTDELVVCTIYNKVPGISERALTALSLFNEVILLEAARVGVPVIDLRLICNEDIDYAAVSPIEPSKHGGKKIVKFIKQIAEQHDFQSIKSVIYT